MNHIIPLVLLIGVCLFSCEESKSAFTGPVNFNKIEVALNSKDQQVEEKIDYQVSIYYYQPTDGPTYLCDSINSATELLFAMWLKVPSGDPFDLHKALDENMQTFIEHVRKNVPEPDCATCRTFELHIAADSIYQNKQVVSMAYNWTVYEGGAHGNYAKWCVVFDKKDGSRVTYARLVKDEAGLLAVAEKAFRQQIGMEENEKMYQLYSFKNNQFHLSNDFVFSNDGLVFYYNPYEIAPYSTGIIALKLPYSDISRYINFLY